VTRPADLPEFARPPVVEVVLDVTFRPIPGFTGAHAGMLFGRLTDRYKRIEVQPPVPVREEQERPSNAPGRITIQFMNNPTRTWMVSADETQLLQVQFDRLIHNWRKATEDEYPRYGQVLAEFNQDYDAFTEFLVEQDLPMQPVRQCEVTYINMIPAAEAWETHADFANVFRWGTITSPDLPELESCGAEQHHVVRGEQGEFIGRLYIKAEPGLIDEETPAYQLSMTFRGAPGPGGHVPFFDIGRRTIVKAFAAVTTEEMHKVWGRR